MAPKKRQRSRRAAGTPAVTADLESPETVPVIPVPMAGEPAQACAHHSCGALNCSIAPFAVEPPLAGDPIPIGAFGDDDDEMPMYGEEVEEEAGPAVDAYAAPGVDFILYCRLDEAAGKIVPCGKAEAGVEYDNRHARYERSVGFLRHNQKAIDRNEKFREMYEQLRNDPDGAVSYWQKVEGFSLFERFVLAYHSDDEYADYLRRLELCGEPPEPSQPPDVAVDAGAGAGAGEGVGAGVGGEGVGEGEAPAERSPPEPFQVRGKYETYG